MKNVIIIGAGQIGSRHLQGLAKINDDLNITVIDPSSESLKTAKERYFQVDNINTSSIVNFRKDIPKFQKLDIAIIATSSKIRKKVIKDLLVKSDPRFFILEKVAFQNLEDFKEIGNIFKTKNINSWVNCPNRAYESYKILKDRLNQKSPLEMKISGGNWGLASNSIHYIDLFSFLTGTIQMQITQSEIDNKIYSSKRDGFLELGGTIKIESINNDSLIMEDIKSSDGPVILSIKTPNFDIEINENLQESALVDKQKLSKKIISSFELTNQSTLTTDIVSRILSEGRSDLIDLENSYRLHKIIIPFFINKMNEISNSSIKDCPIT